MNIIVFEDKLVSRLYPVTTGRPAYAISCASFNLLDWVRVLAKDGDGVVRGWVRPFLRNIQTQSDSELSKPVDTGRTLTLFINARCVGCQDTLETLQQIIKNGNPALVRSEQSIAAALLPTDAFDMQPEQDPSSAIETYCRSHKIDDDSATRIDLIDYPHDIVRFNLEKIEQNLNYRLNGDRFREIRDNIFAADGATIHESAVVMQDGPILLDQNASIGPYCFLDGPAYIGPNSRVIEHSSIKDAVSIGHTAKIGGEVEASVIECYSNKQHHGFLGHSYLGSWINLGAGTCNSDLKNTYGKVNMEYGHEKVSTGMQFIGCIMGDYAKSAINTGIFTGKLIGTCSMVYGFVTTNVPSFVNYARLFGQVTELPPSVMAATQQRMFARRKVQQRPSDIQLLHDMYELTRHERQLAEEPLVF